jgi:hypothetical protein
MEVMAIPRTSVKEIEDEEGNHIQKNCPLDPYGVDGNSNQNFDPNKRSLAKTPHGQPCKHWYLFFRMKNKLKLDGQEVPVSKCKLVGILE